MAHRPDTNRKLSMKTRLIIIAIMFVVITLAFEYGFDSSDESEPLIDFDNENLLNMEKNLDVGQGKAISINP